MPLFSAMVDPRLWTMENAEDAQAAGNMFSCLLRMARAVPRPPSGSRHDLGVLVSQGDPQAVPGLHTMVPTLGGYSVHFSTGSAK